LKTGGLPGFSGTRVPGLHSLLTGTDFRYLYIKGRSDWPVKLYVRFLRFITFLSKSEKNMTFNVFFYFCTRFLEHVVPRSIEHLHLPLRTYRP